MVMTIKELLVVHGVHQSPPHVTMKMSLWSCPLSLGV